MHKAHTTHSMFMNYCKDFALHARVHVIISSAIQLSLCEKRRPCVCVYIVFASTVPYNALCVHILCAILWQWFHTVWACHSMLHALWTMHFPALQYVFVCVWCAFGWNVGKFHFEQCAQLLRRHDMTNKPASRAHTSHQLCDGENILLEYKII